MSWIERLLEEYGSSGLREIPERGSECLSEEELQRVIDSDRDNDSLREHVIKCEYCAMQVLGLMRGHFDGNMRTRLMNSQLYPLPEEITWNNVQEIRLYRDNEKESGCKVMDKTCSYEFNILRSGYYHIEIGTGQVVWRKRIQDDDLSLTEVERNEAASYGMAAGVESVENGIVAFDESLWNDTFHIKLVKRISSGKLLVSINPS